MSPRYVLPPKFKKTLVYIDPKVHVQLRSFLTLNHISFSEWLRNVMIEKLREMSEGHPFVMKRRKVYYALKEIKEAQKQERQEKAYKGIDTEDAVNAFLGEE